MRPILRRPLGLVLVAAMVALTGGGIIAATIGGGGAGTFNLFVESGGGTCTKATPPVAYADIGSNGVDEVCGSAQDAFNATSGHTTVGWRAGSYSAQSISDSTRSCASSSTSFYEDGGAVTLNRVTLNGSDCTRWHGFTAAGGGDSGDAAYSVSVYADPSNKAVDHEFYDLVAQDGLELHSTTDVSWDGGEICCVWSDADGSGVTADQKVLNLTGSGTGASNNNQNVLLENVDIHDMVRAANPDPSGVHAECGFLIGVQGFTLRNARFYNCGGYDLSIGRIGGDPDPANHLFENVTFEPADEDNVGDEAAGNCIVLDHTTSGYQGLTFTNVSIPCPIQFETADNPEDAFDQTYFYSSVLDDGCVDYGMTQPTYRNNINQQQCHSTDVVSSLGANLVGTTGGAGITWDFHLKPTAPAIGLASTTAGQFTAADFGGNARDGDPDSGAYEYGSGS